MARAAGPIHSSIFYQGFSREVDPGLLGQYQLTKDLKISMQNFGLQPPSRDRAVAHRNRLEFMPLLKPDPGDVFNIRSEAEHDPEEPAHSRSAKSRK